MSEIKLTVTQAAKNLGETTHILRNWLKDFRPYIPTEKADNGYNLFTQDGIDVLMRIKKMYREQNLTTKQIEAILAGADKPTVRDEQAAAIETMDGVRELLEQQREFNAELLKRMDAQHEQFEKFVQRRDEQIMYVLRELQESREQKRLEARRQLPWWKRWFKASED